MAKRATKKKGKKAASKKKAKSKRGGGRAKNADGSFSEILQELIEQELIGYENHRDEIRDMLFRVVAPRNNSALMILNTVASRMQTFNDNIFQPAYDEQHLYPWVLPPLASAWFEGVFESCVVVWLHAGEPPQGQRFVPHVQTYVQSQAKMFAMMAGGKS